MTKFFRTNWLIGCAIAFAAGSVPTIARAQAVVAGSIVGEQGQPLAGAGVQIDELNISAAANPAGNFTVSVPAGRVSGQTIVVRARAIGYKPATRTITLTPGRQDITFTLLRDATQLSEVVVTGVTKATEQIKVPFSVTKLDEAQMPVQGSNAITQLQGKSSRRDDRQRDRPARPGALGRASWTGVAERDRPEPGPAVHAGRRSSSGVAARHQSSRHRERRSPERRRGCFALRRARRRGCHQHHDQERKERPALESEPGFGPR